METFTGYLIPDPSATPIPGRVVIEKEKIAAVLPAGRPETERFILPGFIDSHTHPIEYGLTRIFPDLSPARSVAEILEILAAALVRSSELPVLLAFNFKPEEIREHRYLYRRELDRLHRNKPVLVYREDGHSAVANTPALQLLSSETAAGIEFDGAGKPTGVVYGSAYEELSSRLKRLLPPEVIAAALKLTASAAAENGITTLAAMVGTPEMDEPEWQVILDGLKSTDIRMVPYIQTWNPELARRLSLNRVGGCLLLDGSFGSHTAAISGEYADAPGFNGVLYQRDDKIMNFLGQAHRLHLQTAFHAIGDRAIEQLIRCYEAVAAEDCSALRHRIEHAELLTPDLIARLSRLPLILCVQPAFELLWGGPDRMYARRLGERWRLTNPYRSLIAAGVTIAGGSDAPVTPLDPLLGIRAATELPNTSERLSPEDALALFTTNAAYSLKMEDRIGAIRTGMEADLVITTADPRVNPQTRILATIRAGRIIFSTQSQSWH